jgi:hypothetical protein
VSLHQLAPSHQRQVAGLAHSDGQVWIACAALEAQATLVLHLLQAVELGHLACTLTRSSLLNITTTTP